MIGKTGWTLAALALSLCVVLPLLVVASSWLNSEWQVWQHLYETILGHLLVNTFILMVGVGSGVLVIGTGLAWLTAMCRFPGQKFFDWALIMPLAIPGYVLAFTSLGFLDFGGPVQGWLTSQFGPKGYWFPNIRSPLGVVSILSLVLYPYVYLLAREAFLAQGQRMMDASRALGRNAWGAFFYAAFPMARPAIAVGVSLAVMEALADFGAVSIFNFDTFTTAIYKSWFGLFNLNAAAQLSSLLLIFVLSAITVERAMRGKARYFGGDAGNPWRIQLSGWHAGVAVFACGFIFFLAFFLPMGQLLIWAVQQLDRDLDTRYWQLLQHTLMLGGLAALLTTAAALILGVAHRRSPSPVTMGAIRLATLGYALPGSVLAVGTMITLAQLDRWNRQWEIGVVLTGSVVGLLFAYGVRFLAVAHGPVESGLERVRPSMVEAAQCLGSSGWGIIRRVYLPILRPSLLTAILLVLIEVMKEMPATLLLRPFGWDTLSVRIFEMTSEGEWQRAALPAVTLVLAGLLPVVLLIKKSGKRKR
ncbi:MAG: iron ABC transporter permease [Magnetococcales bacterium]|nr:iron ABC transporter permease [Magnetococcales bacterium]NGZ28460.1 iron ABC transporter permease [Magnetococcales bacterium]